MPKPPPRGRRSAKTAAAEVPPWWRRRVILWTALGLAITLVAAPAAFLVWGRLTTQYEYYIEHEAMATIVVVHAAGAPDRVAERFSFENTRPGQSTPSARNIKQSGSSGRWEVSLGTDPETRRLTAAVRRNGQLVPPSAADHARVAEAEQAQTEVMRKEGWCTVLYSQVGGHVDPENVAAIMGRPTGLKPQLTFDMFIPGSMVDRIQIPDPLLRGEHRRDDGTRVKWDLAAGRYEAAYRGSPIRVTAAVDLSLHEDSVGRGPGEVTRPESLLLPRLDTARFLRMRDNPMRNVPGSPAWLIEIVERADGRVVAVIGEGLGHFPLPPDVRKAAGSWSLVVYRDRVVPLEHARVE